MIKKPYSNIDSCVTDKFLSLYGECSQKQIDRYNATFEKFKTQYSVKEAYIASSSGRVEVCGNHTDHNGGKVVCVSIDLDTLAFFLPTNDNIVKIKSDGYPEIVVDIESKVEEKFGTSSALVKGVAKGLLDRGFNVGGFIATFTSNVLGGAGISSSASFEVLVAEIFNFLYNDGKIDNKTKSEVSQFAENVYFGKPCGLLDQTAIAFGGINRLDFADKSSMKVQPINCDLSNFSLVLINTGGDHSDLTDEYASIPREMKEVACLLGGERLIDVGEEKFIANLSTIKGKVSSRAVLRAFHFFEENQRVDILANALEKGDYTVFLDCITKSGVSSLCALQNCYVSGSTVQPIPEALYIAKRFIGEGANRVHGGGFAGSILNVVKKQDTDSFVENMSAIYGAENVVPLKVRTVGTIVL